MNSLVILLLGQQLELNLLEVLGQLLVIFIAIVVFKIIFMTPLAKVASIVEVQFPIVLVAIIIINKDIHLNIVTNAKTYLFIIIIQELARNANGMNMKQPLRNV